MTAATDDCTVTLDRCSSLRLLSGTAKGRGVSAGDKIASGTVIDKCPVLVLDADENRTHIEKTSLYHYTYNWPTLDKDGKPIKSQAVVFGLGSLFNHSRQEQNVAWKRDLDNQLVIYWALRDIRQGEELCISYGDHLTFEDADKPDTNGNVEDADEHLAGIKLDP